MDTLSDLDELILRCRGTSAKAYIAEAVACYRGGANRSAIVATWIAVVFDFLDKLKELEMSGDLNAKQKLADFEKSRAANNWKASLEFERQVITLAQHDFELLSPVEALDLDRLLQDRNRCAHPSMSSPEDPYRPSAELARTHIRNAVVHLLSHPPVQGKAALDRLLKEVESEYFPADPETATEFFKTGPLARAREALIRNFVLVLSKTLLRVRASSVARKRRFAALNAVLGMYTEQGERTLAAQLPELIVTVPDDKWYRVLFFLGYVKRSWEFIGDAAQTKARRYVQNAPDEDLGKFLPHAMEVPALRELAIKRLPEASVETLARIVSPDSLPEVVHEAINRFERARSFRTSEKILEFLVLPLAPVFQKTEVERICKAFVTNSQVTYAVGIPNLLLQLFQAMPALTKSTKSIWKAVFDILEGEADSISTGKALHDRLRGEYGF